ncbi:MAG: hypothetical protein WCY74_02705 [Sphaerochaetaceae bacterium]|jgi:uncharacterized cysteine cluster protein YcgN (CxxCxxCC family)|nr:hypothetical protein [Sphaerochaetaceae bacterium]MDD3942456.1 hypothetical protein [Sphaerochaetaceae bacterium]MDX9939932.1 hypothetical protein [Sphaerochaetaceae bacterium]
MRQASLAWEAKCSRCGLCCHEKVIVGRQVIYDLDSHCEHYDRKTHQCKIYLQRLDRESRCRRVTRFAAMFASYLPESCAYVQWARSRHLRFAIRRHVRFTRGDRGDTGDEEPNPSLCLSE